MYSIRTDLAVEAREIYEKDNRGDMPGVDVEVKRGKDMTVTIVKVVDKKGEKIIGKPMGTYTTIEVPELKNFNQDLQDEVSETMAKELASLIDLDKEKTALVVGLGNWNVTPDALGPKVVSRLMVTRHLKQMMPDEIEEGMRPVCALSPGVLGLTGIETSEIIQGVVKKIKPDLVLVVDALASRKMSRVSTTIQIGNTGINPGSGVGNKRMGLNQALLGVPVIAIGVPTVVDAATMANDTIDLVIDTLLHQSEQGKEFYNMLKGINRDEKYQLIQEVLSPYIGDLMVTPKDVDAIIDNISKIVANGINISLHPSIHLKDINRYIN
ncbi:germination protease precursor [Oxobacter pfennigii]|uniref:Germination protease n=1 Tax=Oxobacter pfennigii TaxID=36849 RepID=A0A0P8WNL0_9CLOT|nr:GPR endopeptidase [Oxobacter pfennigii]KPU44131.1 germination protease precursor [Oxobacter pfennigii]